MTPAARIAAAIVLLDRILDGAAAEQALTAWGRASRFAGSADRAAVRDLVFGALRRRRSWAALGGADTGRGLMLGRLAEAGEAADTLFTGEGHAPAALTAAEAAHLAAPPALGVAEALDCPDWLLPLFRDSLGAAAEATLGALRDRAPVFLRVNAGRTDTAAALAALAAEEIAARPVPGVPGALEVTGNERRIHASAAYRDGLVELQDAASQALVLRLPLSSGDRVLDYCAGGGGKTLAMAARMPLELAAHDADPRRMADLPARAARAGVTVRLCTRPPVGPFDLVLTDVPCSGSGSWRRAPEAKWRLTPTRLAELCRIQAEILDRAAPLVRPGGTLAYATCSVLAAENQAQVAAFLARGPGWRLADEARFLPGAAGDGFYLAVLARG